MARTRTKSGIIYALKDPRTGEIRYVGWTVNLKKRFRAHIKEARTPSFDTHKVRWIRVLLRLELTPEMVILEEHAEDALAAERRWISKLKDEGARLTNATDGGEGLLNSSPDVRRKIQIKTKARWDDPEWRESTIAAARKARSNPQFKQRCSESALKIASREGEGERRSKRYIELWKDPLYKAKVSANVKKSHNTPEFRKLMSDNAKKRWADPEFKKRVSESVKKTMQDKVRLKDPDFMRQCEAQSIRVRELMKDSANRKRISDSLKRYNAKRKGVQV